MENKIFKHIGKQNLSVYWKTKPLSILENKFWKHSGKQIL